MDTERQSTRTPQIDILRQMSHDQKLARAFELSALAKSRAVHELRKRFPFATDAELKQIYLARLMLFPNRENPGTRAEKSQ